MLFYLCGAVGSFSGNETCKFLGDHFFEGFGGGCVEFARVGGGDGPDWGCVGCGSGICIGCLGDIGGQCADCQDKENTVMSANISVTLRVLLS